MKLFQDIKPLEAHYQRELTRRGLPDVTMYKSMVDDKMYFILSRFIPVLNTVIYSVTPEGQGVAIRNIHTGITTKVSDFIPGEEALCTIKIFLNDPCRVNFS